MRTRHFVFAIVLVVLLQTAVRAQTHADKVPLAEFVQKQTTKALDTAAETGNLDDAIVSLAGTFDQAIAYAPDNNRDAVRVADFALRLAVYVSKLPSDQQRDWLSYLRQHPDLSATLVGLIKPKQDPQQIFAVLGKLRQERGSLLDKYANLAAAISVVHARPLIRHINENQVQATDPLAIFDFYVKNESRMFFGIRDVPAELLVWVVDTTASIDEMNWALRKYAGDRQIGQHFFDVQYDYNYLKTGTGKKVDELGYNLPNILRYGGICADQAYFAVEIGKSIGVPTAYTVGESGAAGHAWVGFLQDQNGTGFWNFNTGRYTEFQGVRGSVEDPQTRRDIPDNYVSVLAEIIGTRPVDRQSAIAYVDAAHRLMSLEKASQTLSPPAFPDSPKVVGIREKPRTANTESELGFADLALTQCVGTPSAWFIIREVASAGKMSMDQKEHWADEIIRLGAKKYPDFAFAILMPMIQTVDDPKQENTMLNRAFDIFHNRFDLASAIRMEQAKLWEKQSNTENAGACYMDVIDHYADAGPFVLTALDRAEELLKNSNRAQNIPRLYQECWSKTTKPTGESATFAEESNWYQVGKRYAEKLIAAGDATTAASVEGQLQMAGQ